MKIGLALSIGMIPLVVYLVQLLSKAKWLDWLRPATDLLSVIFIPVILFFDWIGLIPFSILGGGGQLFGSKFLGELLMVAVTCLIFYFLGRLISWAIVLLS